MNVYPVFLNGLEGRRCVVFGGGAEAARKVRELLACDAGVVVIAPSLGRFLSTAAEHGRIAWEPRDYSDGDLRGTTLAIVTDQDEANRRRIWHEAQREGTLLNTVDDVPRCNFIAGSVVRQGSLTIAISTGGAAPALAVRLRERFERELGPEYADFLGLASGLRERIAARVSDFSERRRRWYALVDSPVLALLRDGQRSEALRTIESLMGLDPEG